MFTKIVVAVDGSACSGSAVEVAINLAESAHATLAFCTVADPAQILIPTALRDASSSDLISNLDTLCKQINDKAVADARASNVTAEGRILSAGPAATEIVAYAKEIAADCIVLGTHGRTGLAHALYGSVAEGVLSKAECAVLTVRRARKVTAKA